tara:strand:+ start:19823 stop:19996 length:174 start_codon:yes stop_codon:yes gene_type:complete
MTLDGWSLNEKIENLRNDVERDLRELKINFAMLYDYLKEQEESKSSPKKKKKVTTKD